MNYLKTLTLPNYHKYFRFVIKSVAVLNRLTQIIIINIISSDGKRRQK